MRIANMLPRAGSIAALVLATAVAGLPGDAAAQAKKKSAIHVSPLRKADYKRISLGAAAWFHKGRAHYLYVNDDGGHIRVGGRFRKLRQIAPKGSWGCGPATFRNRKRGIIVRTARHGSAWMLTVLVRNRRTRITGLKCSSGS